MAKSREYELKIKIGGGVDKSFMSSMNEVKKELQASKPIFDEIENASKTAFKVVAGSAAAAASVIAAGTAASISVGSSFESAFAGVKKTTDATAEEYEQIHQGILGMAEEIPASVNSIAEVAEAAGQLGIAKEDLLDFTGVMIDLGESTNMEAAEAASSLAKFANITNMDASNYRNLGSVIVGLGNNFATTESDIVSMATRLAASGELVGLTQAQIMAVATAMSSVGIEAEAGGSAMSKVLKNVQLAVELGGESLEQYSSVAGVTVEEFKQMFKDDALSAVGAFISGLNDTERNGKSAIAILDEMDITEVRMSNTILSLANANGLLTNAVDLANTAWEENTALAKEAAQRYETTESKAEILKNKISNIGISVYDDLREPYRAVIDIASDTVSELGDSLEQTGLISDIADDFTKHLPTAIRKTKEFGGTVADFAEPFLNVGEWLIDNPGVITGTLGAIGTTIATYKVASGITSVATALSALTPAGAAVLGIGAVAGIITGIATSVKKAADEAKKANLAEHFGDISLSLEELDEIAGYVVYNDDIGKLKETISALGELDGVQRAIDDSMTTINKMNWKVSIGMELTADEQEQYKSEIASYIDRCQQYVTDRQYTVNLAVSLLTEDDLTGNDIVSQINTFYADKQNELSDLGKKLNETITDAFQDGLLDMDEVKEITQLQEQMAKIQSAIAGSNFESNLDLLGVKYEGMIDAESFKNLQYEIQSKVDEATADYDKAYTLAVSNEKIMLQDGAIDETEYQQAVDEFRERYLENVSDIQLKAVNFQTGIINNQYKDEIEAAVSEYRNMYDDITNEVFSGDYEHEWNSNPVGMWYKVEDALNERILSSDTQAALNELWNQMQPAQEQLEQLAEKYREAGKGIPESILQGINEINILGMLAGDQESLWAMIGSDIANNEEYTQLIEEAREKGLYVPEEVADAIDDNRLVIKSEIDDLRSDSYMWLLERFSPGFDIEADARVRFNPVYSDEEPLDFNAPYYGEVTHLMSKSNNLPDRATRILKEPGRLIDVQNKENSVLPDITAHAEGGIFDTPHYGVFAEAGPEAFIPIDGSENAINIWHQTGQLLGIIDESGNAGMHVSDYGAPLMTAPDFNGDYFQKLSRPENSLDALITALLETPQQIQGGDETTNPESQIVYSPTLQFYGNAPSREDLDNAMRMSQERFAEMFEKYLADNRRRSFR